MVDSSREAFEKWARDFFDQQSFTIEWDEEVGGYRNPLGGYEPEVQSAWEAWQASRSAAIEECAAVAKKMHGCEKESGCDFADALRALKGEG